MLLRPYRDNPELAVGVGPAGMMVVGAEPIPLSAGIKLSAVGLALLLYGSTTPSEKKWFPWWDWLWPVRALSLSRARAAERADARARAERERDPCGSYFKGQLDPGSWRPPVEEVQLSSGVQLKTKLYVCYRNIMGNVPENLSSFQVFPRSFSFPNDAYVQIETIFDTNVPNYKVRVERIPGATMAPLHFSPLDWDMPSRNVGGEIMLNVSVVTTEFTGYPTRVTGAILVTVRGVEPSAP
jgi:hypothetical protein